MNLKKIFSETKMLGERIYLRGLLESDITDIYVGYYQNAELVKYTYQTPRQIDREHLLKELRQGVDTDQYHLYGIFDRSNDLCIGHLRIGYMTLSHKISDLATFIGHTQYLGKGLAQEAIALGNKMAFEIYDFRKLHSGMFEANQASVKAYLKAGWVAEGRLRGQYWVDGKAMDRIAVACFNPKYFSAEFLNQVRQRSEQYLKDLILT